MLKTNFKMAISSLRNSKWRSLLASVGIIIGTASVITIVSLGEGVKHQVINQINQAGSDLLLVKPGKSDGLTSVSSILSSKAGSFSQQDWLAVAATPHVGEAAPISFIGGNLATDTRSFNKGAIVGTTSDLPALLSQKLKVGSFFTADDRERHLAIIGSSVASDLFQDSIPVGKTMKIRGQDFVVRAVFEKTGFSSLSLGIDLNSSVFIPYEASQLLSGNAGQVSEILLKPDAKSTVSELSAAVKDRLTSLHGGQDDFTILTQPEQIALASRVVNILTGLIVAIAAISLMVGGVGIMNIMLVSVTERTREIGIRKAIGAGNSQLLMQFLVEATILSFMGGIIGVAIAYVGNYFFRVFSSFTPVITLPTVVLSFAIVLAVGIIFGIIPAFRAARKDPIEALRYE